MHIALTLFNTSFTLILLKELERHKSILSAFWKHSVNCLPIADILQKRCSLNFHNIHVETPVLKSLFNKVAGLKACDFIKKRP